MAADSSGVLDKSRFLFSIINKASPAKVEKQNLVKSPPLIQLCQILILKFDVNNNICGRAARLPSALTACECVNMDVHTLEWRRINSGRARSYEINKNTELKHSWGRVKIIKQSYHAGVPVTAQSAAVYVSMQLLSRSSRAAL